MKGNFQAYVLSMKINKRNKKNSLSYFCMDVYDPFI